MAKARNNHKIRMTFSAMVWLALLGFLASPAPPPAQDVAQAASGAPQTSPRPDLFAAALAPIQAAAAPSSPMDKFQVKSVLALDAPIRAGEFAWNDEGVPPGPTTIVVDLDWRKLYVYRGGIEIGRSSIIYGADNKPTPTGIFPILEKDADHVSNLYFVPMPHMLRLTMDGISLHAAEVADDVATNGCVGLPDEFAATLFANTKIGDRVLITNGWMTHVYAEKNLGRPVETL